MLGMWYLAEKLSIGKDVQGRKTAWWWLPQRLHSAIAVLWKGGQSKREDVLIKRGVMLLDLSLKISYPCKSLYLLPARDLTVGGCFDCSLLRFCCGRSASVSGRSTNAEMYLQQRFNGCWAGFWYIYTEDQSKILVGQQIITVKEKKGFKKEKRVEGLSLEKRTCLTKFPSHKLRESFTIQNHNNFLSRGQDAKGIRPCSNN